MNFIIIAGLVVLVIVLLAFTYIILFSIVHETKLSDIFRDMMDGFSTFLSWMFHKKAYDSYDQRIVDIGQLSQQYRISWDQAAYIYDARHKIKRKEKEGDDIS